MLFDVGSVTCTLIIFVSVIPFFDSMKDIKIQKYLGKKIIMHACVHM